MKVISFETLRYFFLSEFQSSLLLVLFTVGIKSVAQLFCSTSEISYKEMFFWLFFYVNISPILYGFCIQYSVSVAWDNWGWNRLFILTSFFTPSALQR